MATRKKKTRTKAKAGDAHSGTSSDHDPTWFSIGKIIRIKKAKGRKARKASKNDVKALLAWVVTQL